MVLRTNREEASLAQGTVLKQVCYPYTRYSLPYCTRLIVKLQLQGISIGDNVRILGKGWSSIVFLAHSTRYGRVAVKARRVDSRRKSLLREGFFAKIASLYRVAPRLYYVDEDFIVTEPVIGPTISTALEDTSSCHLLVRRILWKAYILDRIGISHNELARPHGHILLDERLEPYIIDYESASLKTRPHNVPQLVAGLSRLAPCINITDSERIRMVVREYKRKPAIPSLASIIEAILGV